MNDNISTTTYKKNLGKNFMIIDANDNEHLDKNNFRIRMIHENNIAGLLNTYVQYINDFPSFHYDITGLQSLEVILDTSPITHSVLCKIFSGIYNALISLENYLLTHDHVLLSPEYIYVAADYSDVFLCYYPFKEERFINSISSFFDYILKKVDHNDEKCVYLAYTMHRYCNESTFNLNELYNKLSYSQQYLHEESNDLSTNHKTIYNNNPPSDYDINNTYDTPFSYAKNTTTHNQSIYETDGNTSKSLALDKKNLPDKKILLLIGFTVVGITLSTILFILNLYPLSFYIILLATLVIITGYNGYHILRQQDNTPYIPIDSAKPETINYGTVLLTGSLEDNTHKLIYTGTGEGNDISITHFPFIIGKTDSCSAKVQNSVISRLHAKLTIVPTDMNEDDICIEDLNSTNGTLLNNVPLTPYEKYPITSGDYITFGHLTYIFR